MMSIAHSDEYNGEQLVVIMIVFLAITYLSVFLRCYVRIWITKSFQSDDWLMLIAQITFTISCIFLFVGIKYGIGRHNADLSVEDEIRALKYQTLSTLSYIVNMMFIKISIAIFLLRIAVKRGYIWILRISMVVVAIWSIAIFTYDIFQCIPVQAQWNPTIKGAKCVTGKSFAAAAYSFSVMTIVTDWLYALLPIPMIWSVKMSTQAKVTVVFVLSLGIFASVATLVRLKYIVELTVVDDVLYDGTTATVWTLVEPGVAITAASLITMRPLLRAFNLNGFDSTPSHSARHQSITLRADLPHGHWTLSTVSSNGAELHKTTSRTAIERLKTGVGVSEESLRDDRGSEEYILGLEGIRRTVDVRVESGRTSRCCKTPT